MIKEQNSNKPVENKQTDISSYRSILKATSLFGGVQLYQIVIGIISSKIIAVLLGPLGVGVRGLLQSSVQVVEGMTSLGLSRSAVRDVSIANRTNNKKQIGKTIAALRKLVWLTGILGMLLTIVLSPILSKAAFGNFDYTIPFVILSMTLLFNQLSAGQLVVLQGLRKLKDLAKASAIGSTLGLIVSTPLYYLFGIKGIVPTLLLTSLASLLLSWYFSQKIPIEKSIITYKEAFREGHTMVKMGIVMSVSSVLSLLCAYILRGFIRYQGDIESVGLFTAGFAIINSYVGLIFDAMIKDYYPRLASVSGDNQQSGKLVNQQAEIATFIMSPLLTICLIFMPIIIRLLYSNEFINSMEYIFWAIPGMFFKLASWAIALIFVAKGASKIYLKNEFFGNVLNLCCSLVGFYYLGMKGLGIGFTIGYLSYSIIVWLSAKKEYCFAFSHSFVKVFLIQFVLVVLTLLSMILLNSFIKYYIGCFLLLISAFISYKGMNERTSFINYFKNQRKNVRN